MLREFLNFLEISRDGRGAPSASPTTPLNNSYTFAFIQYNIIEHIDDPSGFHKTWYFQFRRYIIVIVVVGSCKSTAIRSCLMHNKHCEPPYHIVIPKYCRYPLRFWFIFASICVSYYCRLLRNTMNKHHLRCLLLYSVFTVVQYNNTLYAWMAYVCMSVVLTGHILYFSIAFYTFILSLGDVKLKVFLINPSQSVVLK